MNNKYLTEVDVMHNCWISATDAALFSTESATDQCILQPARQCMTCQVSPASVIQCTIWYTSVFTSVPILTLLKASPDVSLHGRGGQKMFCIMFVPMERQTQSDGNLRIQTVFCTVVWSRFVLCHLWLVLRSSPNLYTHRSIALFCLALLTCYYVLHL